MSFEPLLSSLAAELDQVGSRAEQLGLSRSDAWNVLVVAQLRRIVHELTLARGYDGAQLAGGRLFRSVPGFVADEGGARRQALLAAIEPALPAPELGEVGASVEAFGQLYECLLAARPNDAGSSLRKRTGSYYTPQDLARLVCDRAFDALSEIMAPASSPPGR